MTRFTLLTIKSKTYILFSCAFFRGQIEQPVRGLISLINHKDIPIFVAINTEGVYILDYFDNVNTSFLIFLFNCQYHFKLFLSVFTIKP